MPNKKHSESLATADEIAPGLPVASVKAGHDDSDRHFQTAHLLTGLKRRAISSGFITAASQCIQFVLTLGSTMILARLLTPRDFGLLAMVWTIMGFLRVFNDAGLSTATVQREGITHSQVSNLFWVNVAVSGLISLLVAASAPLMAWFYREPRLIAITLALSATFLLAGLAVQHMALLNRQMRFKAIAGIRVGSVLAGVLVGVGLAWLHYGYWSLVWMNLVTSIVALLMTWSASPWRPQFFKRHSGTRALLHFGANLTAGTFLDSLSHSMDSLLIGRFCGAAPLGLYSRASNLLSRPLQQLMAPIEAVFNPSFSRLQTVPARYRQNFIRLYESIALGSFFFTGMFFALAHPLTLFVLGAKWEKASAIFAAMSFAALQYPLCTCASWLFITQGRAKDAFQSSIITSTMTVIAFLVGLPFGALGVAVSYSASSLLIQIPTYYWLVGRRGPVSAIDLWAGFFKHFPVWTVVTLTACLALRAVPNFSALAQLSVCVPISVACGIAFILVYSPSRRIVMSLFSTLRELRNPDRPQGNWSDSESTTNAIHAGTAVSVSVVIPAFNREAFLVKAVNSVLNQSFRDFEIIVVDDGSTDGTRSALQRYGSQIKYVFQNNAGVSAARNAGIALAAGQWIAFLDSDDEWSPDFLERQMRAISENQDISVQIADCRYSDQAGEKKSYFEINGTAQQFNGSAYLRPKQPFAFLLRHLSWQVGSAIIRKDVIERSGVFDVNFSIGEDQDFLARAALHGPLGLLNEKLMTAYRRTEQIENLSRIAQTNPVRSMTLQDDLYRKLQSVRPLNGNARGTLKWLRSANFRAIGNVLATEGKTREARRAYWTAVKISPSAASVGRYLLSFLEKPWASRSAMALNVEQTAKD
ncbi:MAG: oligosaccharide flippase family protein [Limisphaerales bacterium]